MDGSRLGIAHFTMNPAEKAIKLVDRFQQRLPGLSFMVAVWKKFGDDQAGNLAALIAYYAFVSIFPLLLILFTALNIVLRDHQALQKQVVSSALANYPGFGSLLQNSIKSFHETGVALVFGIVLTVLGTRGVANAIQNALNSVWEVPKATRPGFPWSWLRSFGLILVVGVGEILTSVASGFISSASFLPGLALKAAATAVTLVFNIGLFWLAFRLATAKAISWRELRLGAILGGIVWQILQLVGGYYVTHQIVHSRSLYGQTIGVVLGLIAWLYLQAEATLYVAEANVVWVRKLWPRSLAPPPHTEEDVRAYELYAQAEVRQADETVKVAVTDPPRDEKMAERTGGAPGTGSAPPAPPAVSAGKARGEEPHDSGDDR
jgi:YihY family inner membrane protein